MVEGKATYIVTCGAHEDYTVYGVYAGPPGVDVAALAKRWAKEFPDKAATIGDYRSGEQYFDDAHFRAFFIREAGLVEMPSEELWTPNYGPDMERLVESVP